MNLYILVFISPAAPHVNIFFILERKPPSSSSESVDLVPEPDDLAPPAGHRHALHV